MEELRKSPATPNELRRGTADQKTATPAGAQTLPDSVRRVRGALAEGTYSTDQLVDAALDRLLSNMPG